MDDSGPLHSIGELARRTGLTVKAVRYYSDRGIVTPAGRTPAGYRRYTADAVARLELVRTLRELGVDLETVREVVARERPLSDVAAEHAAALDVQIRVLRLRRAVLAAAAERGPEPEELTLVHQLARLSEEERARLVRAFLDDVFHGLAADPAFTGIMRSLSPELPEDPEPGQVRAWVELAELAGDPGFRAYMRQLAEEHAARAGRPEGAAPGVSRDLTATVVQLAGPAVAAGVVPGGEGAAPFVAALEAGCAPFVGPGADVRTRLARRLERLNDPRRERYLRLLATVNGWQEPPSPAPVLDWTVRALDAAPVTTARSPAMPDGPPVMPDRSGRGPAPAGG
ncbi:MerR family transcriptional regulator [Actinacidiphila rubida]|nr:MerR family transcriptional regulator [Actinacidiphila rubida]